MYDCTSAENTCRFVFMTVMLLPTTVGGAKEQTL